MLLTLENSELIDAIAEYLKTRGFSLRSGSTITLKVGDSGKSVTAECRVIPPKSSPSSDSYDNSGPDPK